MYPLLNIIFRLTVMLLFSSALLANDAVLELIRLKNRPASEIQPLIAPLLEASDQAIDNGNSLIIKTTSDRLPAIQALINKLDTAITNLTITVIQSSSKSARDLNAGAAIDVTIPLGRPSHTSGAMHGYLADTDRFKEGESTQIVRTLEGRPAYIKTGALHPVDNFNIYDSGYGYPSISTNTRYIEASSGFMVVPRLSGQNGVMLEVSPWTDTMREHGHIDTHSAHTSIQTKLGEWVEIGSIEQGVQNQRQGYLKHSRSTKRKTLRILIKVDQAN